MYVGPGQVDLCVGGQERADLCVWERDKQICAHGGESRVDLCVGAGRGGRIYACGGRAGPLHGKQRKSGLDFYFLLHAGRTEA